MNTKILFIYPPSSLEEEFSELKEVGNLQQPLGVAYLASVLEKEGFKIRIIDPVPLGYIVSDIVKRTLEFNPDIIGISSVTPTFYKAREVAIKLKEVTGVPIVIGGPHLTALPEETMQEPSFDIGVIGEGEETMLELARVLERGNLDELETVKGIVFRKNGRIVKAPPRPFIHNLDSFPLPARHLLPPLASYHPTPATYKKLPIGTIMTSRGCPFRCTFCSRAVFGSSHRFRSPQNVVLELEALVKDYGAAEVRIWDDTFNADPKRAIAICDEIMKRKLNISWTCLARVNFAKSEVLAAMKRAGCWQISYGIESGNNEILKNIRKGITIEMVSQAIKETKHAGIASLGFFIIGLPGETEMTMRQTIDFAKSLDLDAANFTICTPFPGTELYETLKQKGEIKKIEYDKLMVNLPDKLYYIPRGLSEETVKRYERMAYREFYLRPKFILRQLFQVRSLRELMRKIKALFTIKGIKLEKS